MSATQFDTDNLVYKYVESLEKSREDRAKHDRAMRNLRRFKTAALVVTLVGAFVEGIHDAQTRTIR